jgi:POT family proton-dependent oligopeptide transporter
MMGIWFLGTSMGNLLAGLIAGKFSAETVSEMPVRYLGIVATTAGTGILLALLSRLIQRLMRGVE